MPWITRCKSDGLPRVCHRHCGVGVGNCVHSFSSVVVLLSSCLALVEVLSGRRRRPKAFDYSLGVWGNRVNYARQINSSPINIQRPTAVNSVTTSCEVEASLNTVLWQRSPPHHSPSPLAGIRVAPSLDILSLEVHHDKARLCIPLREYRATVSVRDVLTNSGSHMRPAFFYSVCDNQVIGLGSDGSAHDLTSCCTNCCNDPTCNVCQYKDGARSVCGGVWSVRVRVRNYLPLTSDICTLVWRGVNCNAGQGGGCWKGAPKKFSADHCATDPGKGGWQGMARSKFACDSGAGTCSPGTTGQYDDRPSCQVSLPCPRIAHLDCAATLQCILSGGYYSHTYSWHVRSPHVGRLPRAIAATTSTLAASATAAAALAIAAIASGHAAQALKNGRA